MDCDNFIVIIIDLLPIEPSLLPFLMLGSVQYSGLVRRIKSEAKRNGLCRRPKMNVVIFAVKKALYLGQKDNKYCIKHEIGLFGFKLGG
ncbi:hypothetical protein [Luteirhabdus pelagi]|uniref:hypothetical protein n=1 Tax=Luteirhabdus pelagi TaxID=2792783 RepID=UPI00193ACBDF|nr:hypothetical protein [Luteirhabdus pelagi]